MYIHGNHPLTLTGMPSIKEKLHLNSLKEIKDNKFTPHLQNYL